MPDLPLVKIFDTQELVLGKQPGYILMEYIEEDGGMLDFVDGLNIEQVWKFIIFLKIFMGNINYTTLVVIYLPQQKFLFKTLRSKTSLVT